MPTYEQARSFERIGAGVHVSANVMKVLPSRRRAAVESLCGTGFGSSVSCWRRLIHSRRLDDCSLLPSVTNGRIFAVPYAAAHCCLDNQGPA